MYRWNQVDLYNTYHYYRYAKLCNIIWGGQGKVIKDKVAEDKVKQFKTSTVWFSYITGLLDSVGGDVILNNGRRR